MYDFEKQSDGTYAIKISDSLSKNKSLSTEEYFTDKYDASVDIDTISNVVKEELIKNAILSLIIASIAIVAYISLRFKFSYGVSAVAALLLNVLVTVSLFSIFRLEVSSIFIAAILSIIGYAVNDIIITFDRIRENMNKAKKVNSTEDLENIANESLREILNRSIVTGVTTLIPVVVLIFLGASDIFEFNVALLFGLVIGTLASLFVASQLWLEIEKRNIKKHKPKKKKKKEIYEEEVDELQIKGINS